MEVVFYDVETTIPPTDILEFGAIVLDKTGLYEKESYSTLIHSERISQESIDYNGITPEMVKDAPEFKDVADNIYNILHGRIWAGHNIIQFDNLCIKESFERIGRSAPEPVDLIDTLPLLRNTFGYRAGTMKLSTLGNFFGLGQERHRAIEDARMNLDVLKNCAMIMFLEEYAGYSSDAAADKTEQKANGYTNEVIQAIDLAIENKESIWVSYNGGANPLVPRQLTPVKWIYYPFKLEAYCHQSQTNKNFTQSKIVDVRNEQWEIERAEDDQVQGD